jgi:Spy/CpxP family protein refolding chaperone
MKTRIFTIGLPLLTVILVSLALAASNAGTRGSGGGGGGGVRGGGGRGSSGNFGSNGGSVSFSSGGSSGGSNSGSVSFSGGESGGMIGSDMAALVSSQMGEETLGLTKEQKTKIKAISEENRPKSLKLTEDLHKALQVLKEAPDTGDEARIRAAGKAAGDALTEEALQHADIAKKVKAILTAEQLAKVQELRTQMVERMMPQKQQGAQKQQSYSYQQQEVQK